MLKLFFLTHTLWTIINQRQKLFTEAKKTCTQYAFCWTKKFYHISALIRGQRNYQSKTWASFTGLLKKNRRVTTNFMIRWVLFLHLMNFCNNAKLTKFLLKELPYHRVNIPYAYSQFSDFLNPCLLHKNILIDSLVFMISISLASMITMITVI